MSDDKRVEIEFASKELSRLAEAMSGLLEYLNNVGQPITDLSGEKALSVKVDFEAGKIYTLPF